MRKVLLLALLALCLSACGAGNEAAPGASETPAHAETPEAAAEPALMTLPNPGEQPYYLPPMGFEPAGVYLAEPFGDGGRALLYVGREVDGATPFKVFSAFNYAQRPLDTAYGTEATCFGSATAPDGSWSLAGADGGSMLAVLRTESLSGTLTLDGTRATLSYTAAEPLFEDGTVEYSLAGARPEINVFDLTTGALKLTHYLPTEFELLTDSAMGRAIYRLPAFEAELRSAPDSPRGLEPGDSLVDILARFPNQLITDPRCITAPEGYEERLYGGRNGLFHMRLIHGGGSPYSVVISARGDTVRLLLDEELVITAVEYEPTAA